MPIIVSEPSTNRGKKDARRHREKQKEVIIKKLPEIIANESIITRKGNKTVKIPIKMLGLPSFRQKTGEDSEGIGQGKGQPGDVMGHRPGTGQPGEPGQEPGEDYLDTEIEIEEIIELMLEDLGLPKLEEREIKELLIEIGYKIGGIIRSGPWPLLDRKTTVQEGMRRFWCLLENLRAETGLDEITCFNAIKQANGLFGEALELIRQKSVMNSESIVIPFPIFDAQDMRYREIQQDTENQSNAVIIAMRDVSGSMDNMKVYLSQAMLFWLVRWLEQVYKKVEIRFVAHDTVARIVSEEDFFRIGSGGGTNCYSAYELANSLIESDYPTNRWNVYVWHFSDGEDGNTDRTVEEIIKLIQKGVNMVGYGEVQPEAEGKWFSSGRSWLWKEFLKKFNLSESKVDGLEIAEGKKDLPFLCIRLTQREHILPALKSFLKKDRWAR